MIKDVLIRPAHFFEKIEREKGISRAFFYLFILSLFSTIMSILTGWIFLQYYSGLTAKIWGFAFPQPQITSFILIATASLGFFAGLVLSFIIAGLLHVWIFIFGGKAGFAKTYQILIYSSTPSYLFGWIPYARFVAQLYQLVLLVIGTQKIHKVSMVRAILIYAIPVAAIKLLLIIILGIIMYAVISNPEIIRQFFANKQAVIG